MNADSLLAGRVREDGALALDMPSQRGAVSWGAIVAGAVGAAALSLILLILGTGLGLSSVSPWSGRGASAGTMGMATIGWLTFTQLAAAGMGGYLAGRLRTRWHATHTDEVYFRDTAHGFLAWALATIISAALLTSAIGSILSRGAQVGATAATAATAAAATGAGAGATTMAPGALRGERDANGGQRYFVDALFRRSADAAPAATAAAPSADDGASANAEVGRIFASAATAGALPAEDAKYVAQLVAQRTGLSQADAEKRVADTYARMQDKAKQLEATARDAADQARKTSAYSALWLFVSLLVGAFCASLAATFGGRRRDQF